MNNGPSPDTSGLDENPGRLWFGTSLTQFLKAELRDSPARRVAAFRLFLVTLIIAWVSQALHVPPLGAIAILICLSYDAYANSGQSLLFGMRQLGYIIVTTIVSVLALMFAGNEAWLLLPLSFIIMAAALFHARLTAWPTGIALWYSVAVLYTPDDPVQGIYNALWNIPIIGVLAIGAWTVVHLTIQPQDPLKQLRASIAEQLAAVDSILRGRLADSGVAGHDRAISTISRPGSFGKIIGLLADAELMHPSLRKKHQTYLALLLEIDGLREMTLWLDQTLAAEYRAQPMTQEKLNVYLGLQSACAAMRQGVEESRDVSRQIETLLSDDVLHRYSLQTHPSLLTAIWRALQRIAGLLDQLHQPAPAHETKTLADETDGNEAYGWFPAWFGYDFWATHADSVQFGIKFSLGAILCTLIIESLDWPGINTAIPTCLVAAQTSLGADYRLSLLRLSGAALGGLCAYLYVLVFQSQLDTIAGFVIATTPVWALASWISSGSERIAYLGRQLGFSFALFVLHDFGPVADLDLPRDRVIGILLGIIVMGVIDYALWPRRSIVLARHHGAAALHTLARLTSRLSDLSQLFKHTLPLRLSVEKDLAAAQVLVSHAVLEPDARLLDKVNERMALSAMLEAAENLSGLLQIRRRYRLLSGQQFSRFPDELQAHSRAVDATLGRALESAARVLQGDAQEIRTDFVGTYALLKQSYTEHHRIASLPTDLAMEWELRFLLDQQIMELVKHIQKRALESVSYYPNADKTMES